MFNFHRVSKSIKEYNKINSNKTKFCNAPFTTLTFTQGGYILPCYYNKQITFGKYHPHIDYLNLWKNNAFKTLRRKIDNNKLDFGCQNCMTELLKRNFHTVFAGRYDYLRDYVTNNQPSALHFQISNKCNFKCIMCMGENSSSVRKDIELQDNYKSAYDSSFAKSLIPLLPKVKELSFAGGEPFLIKEYNEIIDIARSVNPDIHYSFATNGSLFTQKDFDFFTKENVGLTISYESTDKKIFESIRKNSNFETVHNNLLKANSILRNKNQTLNVKICPLIQNIYDIPKTFNFLNSIDVNIIFNTVVFPPKTALWILSSTEIDHIIMELSKTIFPEPLNTIQSNNIKTFEGLINQLGYWKEEALAREVFYRNKNVSFEFISSLYYSKVKDYIKKYHVKLKDDSAIDIIPETLKEIEDNEVRLKSMLYLYHLPIHWLVSEMNFRTGNKLKERVLQVAKDFINLNNSFYEQ